MHDAELRSHELSRYTDAIRDASRPCLIGNIIETVGETYFGGMPLVSSDFHWPAKDGHPLSFIGQLHCSDVDLIPSDDGDLLFFYDNRHWGYKPSDLGHAIVVHLSGNSSRVLPELPTLQVPAFFGLRKKTVQPKVYKRVNISLTPSTSYPSYDRKLVAFDDDVAEECYLEFCGTIQPDIQIGGYPSPVQSDSMELDCVNAFGLGTPEQWVLLLQLFEIGDMMWGDAGALYWFIHQDDLASCRFDRVWMVTQCG
jgi:uncharacterized protein YwqG